MSTCPLPCFDSLPMIEIVSVPAPRQRRAPLPLCERYQPPLLLYGDSTSQQLERLIHRMCLDDALVRRGWRLEYVQLEYGLPHYRLLKGGELVGVQDVRSPRVLPRIHRQLAAYLAGIGFTPERARLVVFGAQTPLDADKWRVPHLF